MHRRQTFRRTLVIGILVVTALGASACSDKDPPAPHGIPTATPFAKVPEPTIVPAGTRTLGAAPAATATVTPSPTAPPAPTQNYTVVAGDAMSLIAQRFGTTAAAIRTANNLANDDVRIGQVLRIPAPSATPATPSPTAGPPRPTPPPVVTDSYLVELEDTAFGIALARQITLAELEQANGVAPGGLNNIRAGETIRVPKPR